MDFEDNNKKEREFLDYMNEMYKEQYKNPDKEPEIFNNEETMEIKNIEVESTEKSNKNYKIIKKKTLALVVVLSLVFGFLGGTAAVYLAMDNIFNANPYPNTVEIISNSGGLDIASAVALKSMPSVVGIETEIIYNDAFYGKQIGGSLGTGVIVDENGYILTNSHVVNDGDYTKLQIKIYGGEVLQGELLWNDPVIDLAIIKVEANNLPTAELGDSDRLIIGEYSIAIGNPLGFQFERSVTQGVISGLNRTIEVENYETIEGLIQTDASINPGNSGGPLLNKLGQVIGINTVKIQTGEGLGFAIPINIAKPIVEEFKGKGEFKKAFMGLRGVNVERYLESYNDDLGVENGVYIYQIFDDSPASKSNLLEGDVIIQIDDKEIVNMTGLINQLYKYRPGDTISIIVMRDKSEIKIDLILEAIKSE